MKKEKIIVCLALFFLFFSFFFLMKEKEKIYQGEDRTEQIKEFAKKGAIQAGWLQVEGTNIDLALTIVSMNQPNYTEKDQYAWTMASITEKSNHISFASHNIRNVSKNPIVGDNTMKNFEQLLSFIYPNFVKKHQFIAYTNADGQTDIYRIYAVNLTGNREASLLSKNEYTRNELQEYIDDTQKETLFSVDTEVEKTDQLLSLLTCTRFYGNKVSYSFIVEARKMRKKEKQTLAKVKVTKNYEKIKARMEESEADKNEQL